MSQRLSRRSCALTPLPVRWQWGRPCRSVEATQEESSWAGPRATMSTTADVSLCPGLSSLWTSYSLIDSTWGEELRSNSSS